MGSEVDTTGVITKISDDVCIVSVNIDNVEKSFSFSKFLLYVFGLQCEGNMRNILDEGMGVQLRYKYSKENTPYIKAVWLNEQPDHLTKDSIMRAYYDQKGCIIGVRDDNVLVQNYISNHTVLINKEVIFRDNCRIKDGAELSIEEALTFDAIPFETEHPTGALYQGTCAWVGGNPRLSERFGLALLDDPWDNENPGDVVSGVVVVIPNEVVAFADAGCVHNNSKVTLFRSSFGTCDNIKDVVNVGDKLCMRIRCEYLFNDKKQWFAVQAWKDGAVIDNAKQVTEKGLVKAVHCPKEAIPEGSLVEGVPDPKKAMLSSEGSIVESVLGPKDEIIGLEGSATVEAAHAAEDLGGVNLDGVDCSGCPSLAHSQPVKRTRTRPRRKPGRNSEVFSQTTTPKVKFDESDVLSNEPPLSGVISIVSKDFASIQYEGWKIFVDKNVLFLHGKRCTAAKFVIALTTEIQRVNFEAVKTKNPITLQLGFSHEATCAWFGEKPSLIESLKTISVGTPNPENNESIVHPQNAVKFDKDSPVLFSDPSLSGFIKLITRHSASISYEGLNIFVTNKDFYIHGKPCRNDSFSDLHITKINKVNFEAVRTENRLLMNDGFSHEATCVWVGTKPPLSVITRTFPPMNFSLLEEKDKVFVGRVRKFCLPKLALIVAVKDETTVCLHVNAFGRKYTKLADYVSGKECINKYVKLNDMIEFKIARIPTFFNVLSATDVKIIDEAFERNKSNDLSKCGFQFDPIISPSVLPNDKPNRSLHPKDKQDMGLPPIIGKDVSLPPIDKNDMSVRPIDKKDVSLPSIDKEDMPLSTNIYVYSPTEVIPPLPQIPGIVYKAVPFKPASSGFVRKWYIRCSGTLGVDVNSTVVKILPTNFSIDFADIRIPVLHAFVEYTRKRRSTTKETLTELAMELVYFDGVEKEGVFRVIRVWPRTTKYGRPPYSLLLYSNISLRKIPLFLPELCRGKIVSIPFHNCAIAELMGRYPVLITLKSLVTEEEMDLSFSSIDTYLNVGDFVCVNVESLANSPCHPYLKALKCWRVVKLRDADGGDIVEEVVRPRASLLNKYRYGYVEIFRKEKLRRLGDNYFVSFHSSKLNSDFTLEIPPRSFYLDGKQTDPPNDLDGREVTFHACHEHANGSNISLFVTEAWIGEIPKAVDVLADRLAVPKGVIRHNNFYQGIIEDFPLPTHATCRVNALPVSVYLGEIDVASKTFAESPGVELIKGQRIVMRVCENNMGDVCFLESKEFSKIKDCEDVITRFSGIVSGFPQPMGKIMAFSEGLGDIEAEFDLASVKIPDDMGLSRKNVFDWFDYLNKAIVIGTPVYFTAYKSQKYYTGQKYTSYYHAVEVWFDGALKFPDYPSEKSTSQFKKTSDKESGEKQATTKKACCIQ